MWRGRTTACSRNTRASPKAAPASRIASAIAGGSSRGLLDAAHAASAAAGDGLDEDREADVGGLRDELVDVLGRLRRAQHGNARGDRVMLGGDLVAGHLEHRRGRSDEGDAVLGRPRRELRVLGEESVARVDRIRAATSSATRMISSTSR